jgi:hypothetical protein
VTPSIGKPRSKRPTRGWTKVAIVIADVGSGEERPPEEIAHFAADRLASFRCIAAFLSAALCFASRAETAFLARSDRSDGERAKAAFWARAERCSAVIDAAAFLPPRLPSLLK